MTLSGGAAGPHPASRVDLRGLPPTQRDAKGRVRHEALTDAATQLPNRLHFDVVYRLIWEVGGRGIPVTLIRFDIPGFAVSSQDDQRQVGDRLNLITRQMDMITRLDGDRFGVLLMDCNAFGGMVAAEHFQAEMAPILEGMGLPFSAGVAVWKDWMAKPDDLLAAAEEAMEAARAHGGDRIEVHHR